MNAVAEMSTSAVSDWLTRPFDAEDADALRYMLGISYTRSRAGQRAGVRHAGGSKPLGAPAIPPDAETIARHKAFLEAHRPIWQWLFEHADIELVVDPDEPHIIWGWLLTSGHDVIHAVGCKRSFTERSDGHERLSVDLVRFLLGDRARRHQVCTLELPQLATRGSGVIGMDRPREWSIDPSWLITRMGVGR